MKRKYVILLSAFLLLSCSDGDESNPLLDRIFVEIKTDRDSLFFGSDSTINSLSFGIVNGNIRNLEWQLDYSCPWIVEESMASWNEGVLESGEMIDVTVEIDRTKLKPGYNSSILEIISVDLDKITDIKISALRMVDIPEEERLPVLNTLEPSEISSDKAVLQGEIIDAGFPEYTERGFVISESEHPAIGGQGVDSYKATNNEDAIFNTTISISPHTTYYVRAYAVNELGTAYGNDISFTTPDVVTEVATAAVSDLTSTSVTFNGTILEKGIPEYTEKGFCYTDESDSTPEITDIKCSVSGSGEGDFSYDVDGLDIGATYHVRAYAIQNGEVVYGKTVSFTTVFNSVSVSTSNVSNVEATSATFNGFISDVGAPPYTEKGFCYSVVDNPDISDNKIIVPGTEAGSYSYNINGLDVREKYYVRAYAVQNGETVYGNIVSFTTRFDQTSIVTLSPEEIDVYSAIVYAEISSAGLPPYTERGFCYSASPNSLPDIYDNRIPVSGSGVTGKYSAALNGLYRQTKYYVRAYAVQEGEIVYGNTVNFTTVWEYASVSNNGISNQTLGSVQLNAVISNQGYPKYSEKGFVYLTMDAMEWYDAGGPEFEPTIYDNKTPVISGTTGTGSYSLTLTGIDGNIVCGFRPYLIQDGSAVYGETDYFLSYSLPEVTTYAIVGDENDPSRAQLNAIFEWPGNPSYTEAGFVVSFDNSMPELNMSGVADVPALQIQDAFFASLVTGIPSGMTIYVRAYAKNRYGVSYGNVLTYTNR